MINWFKKKLGLDVQNEKINELISLVQQTKEKESVYLINKEQLQSIKNTIDTIATEVLPKEFNPDYKLVNPLDTSKIIFSFETNNKQIISKEKISANTTLFLQNLGSSIPELISNGLLLKSYRFVFPQGVTGDVMKMANGQGTAVMQAGKVIKHGGYVSNLLIAAPLLAINVGSIVIRQHYLAKINYNLNEINLKISQLLELEFVKKHSKVESIIYFLEKAHHEFQFIESNKEYRSAILTNLVKTNIEIFELIQFYKKSFQFINKENSFENELNLKYFLVLHKLFNQGKLLEFKYAMEYNEILISNLKSSFEQLNTQSISFLKENQTQLSETIQSKINGKSNFDWFLGKRTQKEKNINNLSDTKEIITQIIEIQIEDVKEVTNQLDEFNKNITRKQEFLIENGELYEVLE